AGHMTCTRPQAKSQKSLDPWVPSTHDPKATSRRLLDHLVGAVCEIDRVEAERLGGLAIDDQLEPDRGLDGKLARRPTLEDAISIGRRAPKAIEQVISVGQQAAELNESTKRINGRETVTSSQRCDLCAMRDQERIRQHDKAAIRRACLCGNRGFEL